MQSAPAKKQRKQKRDDGTGSIYKDGNGWRIVVPTGDIDPKSGKLRTVKRRCETHEEAVRLLNKMISERQHGTLRPASHRTVATYMSEWVEEIAGAKVAHKTKEYYESPIRNFIGPSLLGRMKLEDVTPTDVQRLLNDIAKRPRKIAPATGEVVVYSRRQVEVVRCVLRAAFNHAMKRDRLILANPVEGTAIPISSRRTSKRVALDAEQATQLLAVASEDSLGSLVAFLLCTGTRIGEAISLQWRDIDFKAGRVRIASQLQRQTGRGMVRIENTKTDGGRTIALNDGIMNLLQSLKSRQTLGEALTHSDGYIFLNNNGNPFDPPSFNRRLVRLCDLAKVPRVSAHNLRHTAATLALEGTGDLQATARLLGHKKTSLTADLYGHVLEGRARAITDAIGNALFPLRETKEF